MNGFKGDPPEPTKAEAYALILGLGIFWAGWAPAALVIDSESPLIAIPFIVALAAAAWVQIGGVNRIMSRWAGVSKARLFFWPPKGVRGYGWMRIVMPPYLSRAIRKLGWRPAVVFPILGALLAIDLIAYMVMMSQAA